MSEFALGSYVRKPSGAFWEGVVVGHYGTKQTEDGVAVQLFGWEDGPVQIYPVSALQLCDPAQSRLAPPLPMVKLTDDELSWIQAAIQLEKPGMVVFPTTPPPSTHVAGDVDAMALKAVEDIFADLRDRRFLKWLFDRDGDANLIGRFDNGEELRGIDLEAQAEIKADWQAIIAKALSSTEGKDNG